MSERVYPEVSGADRRRIESLFDPIYFDTLFDYANTLFVSRPVEKVAEQTELSPEAQLVAQLGTRAIRSAYELSTGVERMDSANDSSGDDFIRIDSPLREPELFSGPLDRERILRTEKLGDAMMDEMFRTLGQDAYVMADKLREAKTDREQESVIYWLNHRLATMATTYEDEANPGMFETYWNNPDALTRGFVYHPVHLSGKVIGTYPNHRISPTCLGVSIAAAGFMKRAGLNTLHAGVMNTRRQEKIHGTIALLQNDVDRAAQKLSVTLPEKFMDRAQAGITYLTEQNLADTGYHACVFVQLQSGNWMQFDSNFGKTLPLLVEDSNQRLTKTYDFLKEMKEPAPGLEVSQDVQYLYTEASRWQAILNDLPIEAMPTMADIANELTSLDPNDDALPMHLYDRLVQPVLDAIADTSAEQRDAIEYLDRPIESAGGSALIDAYHDVLDKYLLDGMPISNYLERCRNDRHFLARATNDIRALPIMMGVSMAVNQIDRDPSYFFEAHGTVEVGLPEARIGLSALNDLAAFHDISPSPTFWLSNWPSLLALTELPNPGATTGGQRAIVENNFHALLQRELLYTTSYGKLKSIQSDLTPREDDHAQEEIRP